MSFHQEEHGHPLARSAHDSLSNSSDSGSRERGAFTAGGQNLQVQVWDERGLRRPMDLLGGQHNGRVAKEPRVTVGEKSVHRAQEA